MGVVYDAEDLELQRFVALKIPHLDTDEHRWSFQKETRLLARVKHPAIIEIYDAGEIDGRCYFTMPYMKGGSLAEPRRKEYYAANPRDAARLVRQLALAVHHAHLQDVYHRDLKPANILFDDDDRPYVSDFGLAKDTLSEGLSASTAIKGTAKYLAPEQVRGTRNPDWRRIDVHGLGGILYEILTRSPPHEGDSTQEVYWKVLHEEPSFHPSMRSRRHLETIALKCLRKAPDKRYETALELAADLERYLEGKPILARPISLPERVWMLAKRHPAWTAIIACALIGLSGLGYSEHQRSVDGEEFLARERAENRRGKDLRYVHHMREACQDLEARRFDKMAGLMRTLSEISSEVELRDFEFFHAAKRGSQMIVGLPGLNPPVRSIAISPDGVSSFLRDSFHVRALHDEDIGHHFWDRGGTRTGFLALLPRLRVAAGMDDDFIRVWDACTGELLEEVHTSAPQMSGAYAPDGTLFSGGVDGIIHAWKPQHHRPLRSIQAHDGPVLSLVFLGRTDRFATSAEDGRTLLWGHEGEGFSSFSELSAEEPILALASFPDGSLLAGAGSKGTVHVWSERCNEPVRVNVSGAALRGIAISPDGRLIAAGGDDRFVHVLRVTPEEGTRVPVVRQIRKLAGPNKEIFCLAFTHDGKRLITGAGDGGLLWDMTEIEEDQAHDEPVNLDPGKSAVTGVAFASEGDRFYTAHEDLTLREWILTGKSRKARVRPGREKTFCGDLDAGIALSPGARWAVVKTGQEELSVWSLEEDCIAAVAGRFQPLRDAGPMRKVAFSPDGRVLAAISPGDDLRTWRLDGDSWVFERRWPRPSRTRLHSGTWELALSPSGAFAAVSGHGSGEIAVWRLDREGTPPTIHGSDEFVPSLAFTPDEKFLLIGTGERLDFIHLETLLSKKPLPYWQWRILRHHESAIVSIGFTRRGNPVTAGANGELIFWRHHLVEDGKIAGGSAARFTDHARPIAALAFSSSNEFLVTGGAGPDGRAELRLWRTFTPEEIHSYRFSW